MLLLTEWALITIGVEKVIDRLKSNKKIVLSEVILVKISLLT